MKKKEMVRMMTAVVSAAMLFSVPAMAEAAAETETEAAASETVTEEEGTQHLHNLEGTYEPLFNVILQDEYSDLWLDTAAAIVGDDSAQEMVDYLQNYITGELVGEEAAETYTGFDDARFYCGFLQDVAYLTVEGDTISGTDEDGNELFSYEYSYVGYDENSGFYEYQTDAEDAGEFTYFLFGFDEPGTTYHIEFRYGSDLEALNNWTEGDYAYWMASGILTGEDQEQMAHDSVVLFVEENLGGE